MRLLSGSLGSNHQDPIGNKPLGFHGLSWVNSTRIHNNIFYAFYAFFFHVSYTWAPFCWRHQAWSLPETVGVGEEA